MVGILIFLIVIVMYNLNSFLQFLSSSFINTLAFTGFTLFFLSMYGILFLGIPLSFYRNRNPRILHCTEGLIYRRGKRTITMPWHEIESVSESHQAMHKISPIHVRYVYMAKNMHSVGI